MALHQELRFLVQGQVESQHIDPRFTEDSEVAALGVRTDDFFQCLSADTPCLRHSPRLQESILKTDVRVQAAARCRHRIGGDQRVRRKAVFSAVGLDALLHRIGQFFGQRPQVGSGRVGGVIARFPCGRWARVKILRAAEVLSDQLGAHDVSATLNQRPFRFVREQALRYHPNHQGVDAAQDNGQRKGGDHSNAKLGQHVFHLKLLLVSVHPERVDFGSGQGRSDFATAGVVLLRRGVRRARTPAWAERRRLWMDNSYTMCSAATARSISLIPKKGATTPPRP